ncbi:DUF1824 family protein [Crocosphaera sp. UHCC 0190]|uniref:DUF1824 family protein n=1 Tax=Crocosphaera sp. UHCC 0190 TaxID=3110246 RepID=UPI002B21333B|nr:DUF1824 family protein [Crocosphaera sp. UHCC 0190]MEA5511281.1 DUF1824 family protein [Crocosphaera sp. UHCC 0190]
MTQPNTTLTVEEAQKLLADYSCLQVKIVDFYSEQEKLRQAIRLVSSLCDTQNIGICADNSQEGFKSLKSYLKALGYSDELEIKTSIPKQTPIYIKFNTEKMSYYVDSYTGSYRGVLLSCQCENHTLVGTYGHFPLNLFCSVS